MQWDVGSLEYGSCPNGEIEFAFEAAIVAINFPLLDTLYCSALWAAWLTVPSILFNVVAGSDIVWEACDKLKRADGLL